MSLKEAELPVFSFGWELEATKRASQNITDVMVGHDGSVSGDGLEYRTRREAVFAPERSLLALRTLTMDGSLQVDRSCGFHVHVGLGMKTRKLHSWAANFVTLARLIEEDAFKAVPESRRQNTYCRTWKDYTGSVLTPTYNANKMSNSSRYCWVNPVEIFRPGGIRTIEVRLMGHSKSYLHLLAWTSFCRRMGASAWTLVHDPSQLEQEVNDLKGILKMLRQAFITHELEGRDKARAIVVLAVRAGFYESLAPSLKRLKSKEQEIRYAMDHEAEDRDNYNELIKNLRETIANEAISVGGTHSREALNSGTIVEALVNNGRYGLTAGNHYRVAFDEPRMGRLAVEGDATYSSRYVLRSMVRVVTPRVLATSPS